MFKSRSLTMDDDHLDVSFRNQEAWPAQPWKSINGVAFRVGDPQVGPSINLAAITPLAEEPLDWAHTIDPMHFHGTDQFRLLLDGAWITTRQPLDPGGFGFQEAGRVYQEHPGDGPRSWLFLVYGDRRGEAATLTLRGDRDAFSKTGEDTIAGAPVAAKDYRHPAGPKGIPAVATTVGPLRAGHLWGSFAEPAGWQTFADGVVGMTGAWGEAQAGPVVCLLKSGPDQVVAPASTYDTEVLVVVSGGACRIGDDSYQVGDLRVQSEGSSLGPIMAGPDGVDVALLIADRRAATSVRTSGDDVGRRWALQLAATVGQVATTIGSR